MPATNYTWTIDEKPIFQVYGTKRKGTCSGNEGNVDNNEEVEKKRRCIETRQCLDDEMVESMDVLPVNESINCLSNPATVQQPAVPMISFNQPTQNSDKVLFNDRVPPLPIEIQTSNACVNMTSDNLNNNNNNNNPQPGLVRPQHTTYPSTQENMIMDLNDEVYSTAQWPLNAQTDAEYEAACNMVAAMEAEGGPDPNQYKILYCDSQCVDDTTSRSSREVRSACKSMWEGVQNMGPYVSDYY